MYNATLCNRMNELFQSLYRSIPSRDTTETIIDFLSTPAVARHAPTAYKQHVDSMLTLLQNRATSPLPPALLPKISRLIDATKIGVQNVGFDIYLDNRDAYRGKSGVSPALISLYEIDCSKKVELGVLVLDPQTENDLPLRGLRLYERDAETLLGPQKIREVQLDQNNRRVICSAKVKLSGTGIPVAPPQPTVASQTPPTPAAQTTRPPYVI